jgi:hypothetical protein
MIVGACQRWRERRGVYLPADRFFEPSRWEVAEILDDTTAKTFVKQHHYSGSYPAAKRRFGLYFRDQLEGVAVFSVPSQPKVLEVLPGDKDTRFELGRFVLTDWCPANSESWFIARIFEVLRRDGWTGIISHSDPVPRPRATGEIVFGGHVGTTYQATNGRFIGKTKPRTLALFPDGTELSGRAKTKIRKREKGWRYSAALLERWGAEPLDPDEDSRAWLRRWAPRVTKPIRHDGNLKYVWALNPRDRKHLPKGLPYPKLLSLPLV